MSTQYIDPINGSDSALVARTTTTKSTITAVSKANPCQVTLNSHGFSTGDIVHLGSISGMSQINNQSFTITVLDANNFTLNGVDSTAYSTYTSGGTATPSATRANPAVICSLAHGFGNGQLVKATSMVGSGWTNLNNLIFKIKNVTTNTFEITDINGNNIDSSGFAGHCSNAGTWTQWRKIAIQSITQANPAVVTAKGHGYSNGNLVVLEVAGMTQVNGKAYTVANVSGDTFELSGIDSSAYSAFTSGTVTRPFLSPNTLISYYSSSVDGWFYTADTVKIGKTFIKDSSIQVGSGNITFVRGSNEITTSVDLTGVLSANQYIGLTSATVKGWDKTTYTDRPPIYYKILSITSTKITIECRYGGVSATVSSVNRLRSGTEIVNFGVAGAIANSISGTSGVVWEGSHDFIHNTAVAITNGESAFKAPTSTGDIALIRFGGISETLRYMGLFEFARGFITNGTNVLVEYCYTNSRLYYGFQADSNTATIKNCTGVASSGNLSPFYTNSNASFIDCYGISVTNSAYALTTNSLVENCKAEVCGATGFTPQSTTKLTSCIADFCGTYGFFMQTNSALENCIGSNNSVGGAYTTTTSLSLNFKNSTFTNNGTYGINLVQNFQSFIDGCTFSGNNYDIYADQYTNHLRIWNCDFTAPTSFAIGRVLNSGAIDVRDCTIDAPSIAKAIQIVSGASYNLPQYTLENSFGLPDGQYYANTRVVKDTSVYRTSGYSLKFTNSSTLSNVLSPTPALRFGVNAGVARTLTYYLKIDSGTWSGTLTPQLRLGGTVIKVGTDITSITTSWVQHTISVTGGEVTHDAELMLEFINNGNTTPFRLDDAVIT